MMRLKQIHKQIIKPVLNINSLIIIIKLNRIMLHYIIIINNKLIYLFIKLIIKYNIFFSSFFIIIIKKFEFHQHNTFVKKRIHHQSSSSSCFAHIHSLPLHFSSAGIRESTSTIEPRGSRGLTWSSHGSITAALAMKGRNDETLTLLKKPHAMHFVEWFAKVLAGSLAGFVLKEFIFNPNRKAIEHVFFSNILVIFVSFMLCLLSFLYLLHYNLYVLPRSKLASNIFFLVNVSTPRNVSNAPTADHPSEIGFLPKFQSPQQCVVYKHQESEAKPPTVVSGRKSVATPAAVEKNEEIVLPPQNWSPTLVVKVSWNVAVPHHGSS